MRYFGEEKKAPTAKSFSTSYTQNYNSIESSKQLSVDFSLSDEQQLALQEVLQGHSVVIEACVGAGKTTFLEAVCRICNDRRILYLTYNRLLKEDAQKKITGSHVTVQNYHGFVYKYLVRRGIKVSPHKQIKTFLERCSDVPLTYSMLVIDEFQDIEEDTVELLLHLKNECPRAQWVFVGDMQQKIYDKTKIDVYKDCINKIIPDYTPLKFTKSFRISSNWGNFLSRCWLVLTSCV